MMPAVSLAAPIEKRTSPLALAAVDVPRISKSLDELLLIVPSSPATEVDDAVPDSWAQVPPPLAVPQPVWLLRTNVSWTR